MTIVPPKLRLTQQHIEAAIRTYVWRQGYESGAIHLNHTPLDHKGPYIYEAFVDLPALQPGGIPTHDVRCDDRDRED